jgi:hypothetical protein
VSTAVRVITYRDWAEFKRDLLVELFGGRPFRQGVYLFRGEGDADHVLSTYFDRRFAGLPMPERMALWDRLVAQWRAVCREEGRPEADGDEARLLALGQHYDLPTRLLDWSTSPYVAAFFAFRAHLLETSATDRVAVWVLHLDNPVWTTASGVEVLHLPAEGNLRLRRQNGRFTLCRAAVSGLEEYVERFATSTALTKCVLPAVEARVALSDLDAMGLHHHTLFPELGGLANLAVLRAVLADDAP